MREMQKKTKTSGNKSLFSILFNLQEDFQKEISGEALLPQDNNKWFQYHMLAMQEELGEVLAADKRWKSHRNQKYDKEEKALEIADVFITAMNIAIYSGIGYKDLMKFIGKKIDENYERLEKVKNNDSNS